MLFLTTTHYLLAYNESAGFRLIHTGKGLYYGLAQHRDSVYVACRNTVDGPLDPYIRAAERGSILVLDSATLKPVHEWIPRSFPLRDVHGIAIFDEKLWITCSLDNMVAIYDLQTSEWSRWYPSPDPAARGRDVNHFNTVAPAGAQDRLQLLAHNNGPSELFTYRLPTLELESVQNLGLQAHDLFAWQGHVATCSSGEGMLASAAGWRLVTGGVPRGFARTSDSIWVGISQRAARDARLNADGILRRYSRNWSPRTDFILPRVGMVLQVLNVKGSGDALNRFPVFEHSTQPAGAPA